MTRAGRRGRAWLGACLAMILAGVPAGAGQDNPRLAGLTDRELYEMAVAKIEKGSYFRARTILERIVRRGNEDPDLSPLVQLALADAYYGKKGLLNLTEALTRYQNFLTFFPTHERADYAQYRLGLCHYQQVYAADRDQRETVVAVEEFRKVQIHHSDSPYVDLATEKIQEASDLLAEHEIRVGMFYLDRKAYLGAIDRFLYVLDRYPRYSAKDRLYFHLGHSLIQVRRDEEGEVYLRKVVDTYPGSEYARRAAGLLEQRSRRASGAAAGAGR